jgi:hypothetical protein
MKARVTLLAICALVFSMSSGLVACGGNEIDNYSAKSEESFADKAEVETTESESNSSKASSAYLDVSNVDFQSIDTVVEYCDYTAMLQLQSDVLSGKALEKVVRIEGLIGSDASQQLNINTGASGEETASVQIEITGGTNYPNGGARVILVGVVRTNDKGTNVIVVPSSMIAQVKEGETVIKLNDANIVLPTDWTIKKDNAPMQIIIGRGSEEIEIWCDSVKAKQALSGSKDIWKWEMSNTSFLGATKSSTRHDLVHGSMWISGSGIYLADLKSFLESNLIL